jgi:glycosyltransferase involved in cell wall biosynthesis
LPETKTRVLRVIARLNIGGPAIHVVNLTAGLDPSRFEQRLVVGTENPGEGSMLDYALQRGVQPLIMPEIINEFSLRPRDAKALLKLYRLMRQWRPHVVHTHTARAGFLGRLAARLAGVPVVVHTYHGHVLHGYWGASKTWLIRRLEHALARITDQLVTVSEQVKRELVTYGVALAEKIAVIPLGFDLQPLLNCQSQGGQFRRELGLEDGAPLIGIVGRLFPIKNHRLFLNAAARMALQLPSTRFVIVGDGTLRADLEHYAHELGFADRVIFTGWRRDLPNIYADLDVLVVSSDNEGTPVSAIEAMAAGCPVVATRVGGLVDLIADGESGYLVPLRNPHELATAVLRLLQEPKTACRMAQAARVLVVERFTIQRLITDIEHLYEQLLAQKGTLNLSEFVAASNEGCVAKTHGSVRRGW